MKKQHNILIVEPDLPVRHPVAEYLRECGYRVLEAANTDEAKILLMKLDSIEVVLVDIGNPGNIDVFALSHWIRARNHNAKMLMAASVRKLTESAMQLCEDGPDQKAPYHHQQLLEEIKRLLAAHYRAKDGQ